MFSSVAGCIGDKCWFECVSARLSLAYFGHAFYIYIFITNSFESQNEFTKGRITDLKTTSVAILTYV